MSGTRTDSSAPGSSSTIFLPALDRRHLTGLVDTAIPTDRLWRNEVVDGVTSRPTAYPETCSPLSTSWSERVLGRNSPGQQHSTRCVALIPYKGLQVFSGDDSVRFYGRGPGGSMM